MGRTVINIDDDALRAAAEELGTTTKVDTVNAALRVIAARRKHRRLMELIDNGDLLDPGEMRGAWRP